MAKIKGLEDHNQKQNRIYFCRSSTKNQALSFPIKSATHFKPLYLGSNMRAIMLRAMVASNWTQNARKGCKTRKDYFAILTYKISSFASNFPQVKGGKIDALELYSTWNLMLMEIIT